MESGNNSDHLQGREIRAHYPCQPSRAVPTTHGLTEAIRFRQGAQHGHRQFVAWEGFLSPYRCQLYGRTAILSPPFQTGAQGILYMFPSFLSVWPFTIQLVFAEQGLVVQPRGVVFKDSVFFSFSFFFHIFQIGRKHNFFYPIWIASSSFLLIVYSAKFQRDTSNLTSFDQKVNSMVLEAGTGSYLDSTRV